MRRGTSRRGDGEGAPAVDHDWVDDQAGLAEVVSQLLGADRYAVDTEFHREKSYWPQVALIQVAWGDRLVLIDPLAVDLGPLAEVFAGDGLAVMHAASQDIEVFERSVGSVPSRLFDTQIAAGFLGYGTPSLTALVEGEVGVRLPKGDRLTDWLRRPLDDRQRAYAASDVAYLLDLHDRLWSRLTEQGRDAWVADECDAQRRWRPRRSPSEAYLRIKEARQMRGRALGVVQAVAAWREQRAAEIDIPARHVMADLAVVTVSGRAPRAVEELQGVRGLDDRLRRGPLAEELVAAVAEGLEVGPPPRAANGTDQELDRRFRPAVALVSAWVAQLARTHKIDTSLLATRADIEDLLVHSRGRLSEGWRAELVGGPVRDLVDGRAALAFEGDGLVLEPRSRPS
ncbi:MAG TPA: HRDC domain-containing protein [Acidimicrobiales bacterium]|nr:HRDC domain-containing protein [Acidimicrobiales bacterium]